MKFEYNYNCKKEEGKPQKTRKAIAMKKASLEYLVTYLSTSLNVDEATDEPVNETLQEIVEELKAELNKGKEKADANRALYEEYREKVMDALRATPTGVTAQDLADETGISRGKIVYGLSRMWASEIVKDASVKPTLYRLA